MKKSGFAGLLSVLLLLSVFLMGCPVPDEDDPINKKPPIEEPDPYTPVAIGTYSGTGTGTAGGFAKSQAYFEEHGSLGSDITVTVTMENGWMTSVQIEGPDETSNVGGYLVGRLGNIIKKLNTFDVDDVGSSDDIDGISGATLTFEGIKEAGGKAIDQIKAAAGE